MEFNLDRIPNKGIGVCGIYCIYNTTSGKYYVGSSVNIYTRVHRHKSMLKRGKHPNGHLQHSFNKYGIASFMVCILEECCDTDLVSRERHWIDKYDCCNECTGYNQCSVTDIRSNEFSNATKSKMSRAKMHGKHMVMYHKTTGEKLLEFSSLFEAAEYIISSGISISQSNIVRMRISQSARNKTTGVGGHYVAVRRSAYGCKWRFE